MRGRWAYLYRAIDKEGNTVDFRLSPKRDVAAAKAFFRKALRTQGRAPLRITLDGDAAFPEMQSCAANVTVHLKKALDPVVTGISTLGPIISWLFRDKRKLCNSLHILQAELYRNKQAEWCAVVYG